MTNFRVAARTLVHLGAELITSDEIAIYELIKNSFDAGSPRVAVRIEAPFQLSKILQLAARVRSGSASIREAVSTFSAIAETARAELRNTWLQELSVVSSTGEAAEVLTRLAEEQCSITIIDTGHGMSAEELAQVFLVIGTSEKFSRKLMVAEPSTRPVLGDKGIGRLSMMRLGRFARVMSARSGDASWSEVEFDWREFERPDAMIDDIDLAVEHGRPLESGEATGTQIRIWGLKADWGIEKAQRFASEFLIRLRNPFRQQQYPFPINVTVNGGDRIPTPRISQPFLESAQVRGTASFAPVGDDDPGAAMHLELQGQTIGRQNYPATSDEICQKLSVDRDAMRRLGPFHVDFYWYNRAQLSAVDGLRTTRDIRRELDRWAGGFAIYRDGFRVGLTGSFEDDWLQLDSRALRGTGYTVNRLQVIGAISVDSSLNPRLIDRSNREGLIECPERELLRQLVLEFVVRPLRVAVQMAAASDRDAVLQDATEVRLQETDRAFRETRRIIRDVARQAPGELKPKLDEVDGHLETFHDRIRVLHAGLRRMQETREDILEMAGVGLVVEGMLHELARITATARESMSKVRTAGRDSEIRSVFDVLEAQMKAINTRIRAVDPLSPSGRQRKEEFDLVHMLETILKGFAPRFTRHGINTVLTVRGEVPTAPVPVKLVRGLIAHVFENLLANAAYWLRESKTVRAGQRSIEIDVDDKAKTVSVTDNGPGIAAANREHVFEPLFSLKPKGKGLGLYIAREIARYHGAALYLDPAADGQGQLHTFVLELPKE